MSSSSLRLTRRTAIASAAALAACGPRKAGDKAASEKPTTIAAAVAGTWRAPADRARDGWRHPAESLAFWGLKPGQT
ncbi:MAG: class I SAM-dependent methyltransferase, partial [Phenylobacterium sp.]